jgi:hypothetical protein
VIERVKGARPRNQLGQPATTTPAETIARLREKVAKNHGGANRERIQAQISDELANRAHSGAQKLHRTAS